MTIFPITPGVLRRLAGRTIADDLRAALHTQILRIRRAERRLTNKQSILYGNTFWMVTAAEVIAEAEPIAAELRGKLDQMGEHHGEAALDRLLRQEGFLPPMTPQMAAEAVQRALRGEARAC